MPKWYASEERTPEAKVLADKSTTGGLKSEK